MLYFFSPAGVVKDRSTGIIAGAAPMLPMTAVTRSCVIVPITPPMFTIFVESKSEASVVRTRPRAIGMLLAPMPRNGWPQT